MKKRQIENLKLTSERERRKKFIIKGVVKRGSNPGWETTKHWTGRVCKILALAALVAGLCVGATVGYRKLFWENPDYALTVIEVHADGPTITREQVIKVAGLVQGRNIFSYHFDAVRDALKQQLSSAATVDIRRYLPNRVEITITERKPVAWLTARVLDDPAKCEHTHLLDASGVVFQPHAGLRQYDKLPVIGGVEMEDIELGKEVQKFELKTALALLCRAQEMDTFKVVSIDASKGYCLVVTDQKRTKLTFGLDDIEGQLQRHEVVQREAANLGQELQTVNLMLARNIPVTFAVPQAEEVGPEPILVPAPVGAPPKNKTAVPEPKGTKTKPTSPAKKPEPAKPSAPPKRESDGVLKRFRTA